MPTIVANTAVPNTPTLQPKAGTASGQSGPSGVETPVPATAANAAETAPVPTAVSSEAGKAGEAASGGPAMDPNQLMQLVMSTPGAMDCVSGKLGMMTMMQMQMTGRAPTDKEMALLQSCLGGGEAAEVEPTSESPTPGPTAAPKTILTQALESPGAMWCLSDKVGMEILIELEGRFPTSQERSTINSCLFDIREISAWNAEWPKRIDAAFTPVECGAPPVNNFPASYYQGPFIDTHLHLPQLPDHSVSGPADDGYVQSRGEESDKYDTIAEEQRPLMGTNVTVGQVACSLQNEGTIKAFTFFPTFPEVTTPAIDVAYRTVEKYPSLFVPFLQASANGSTTLAGTSLEVMLGVRPNLFFGFGEVGSSPTESDNPAPDSEIYTGDWEVVRNHGLTVWYHPGEGHIESLERAIQDFPEITFIVHGDVIRPYIDGILDRNPNVYFTFNDIFDDLIPTFRFGEKAVFISDMRNDWDRLLDEAYAMYESLIKAHPDRYMWGTDRGDIAWQYDEEIGQLLTEYARAFIGRFDTEIQDLIAYKNAERLIGDYGQINSRPAV